MATKRLTGLADVADAVAKPGYDPAAHGAGIVHLGLGAFHRAHQAVYTDDALAAEGGDWRIVGVSLRSTDIADALNPQNGLYTLITRGEAGTDARIIASIDHVIAASRDREAVVAAMTEPAVRIVSLTVTEKAYGIDRAAGTVDMAHSAIAADLANPHAPTGALGFLAEALRRRREAGVEPFTVLCCDNLPDNGALVRLGLTDFARRVDSEFGDWIAANVAFPSTMVDRITPAATDETLADAARLTGCEDHAAIETEPFTQWVIEDHFPGGRPAWQAGGAVFVEDVAPYERMKLRMLNGAHSMLAYSGFLAGHTYVRDVMGDPSLAALVERHLRAAASTLSPLPGVDFAGYAAELVERFRNPAIAHATYQIAMDGTEKLPQRLLKPAAEALRHGRDIRPFAFAVAAWMRYCLGRKDDGETYTLRDPREEEIAAAIARAGDDASSICRALSAIDALAVKELWSDAAWNETVVAVLDRFLRHGAATTIAEEAA